MFRNCYGEMTEWLKVHAWKACVRNYRTKGSNPFLSAIEINRSNGRFYFLFSTAPIGSAQWKSVNQVRSGRKQH